MPVLKFYRFDAGFLWWHNFFNTNILCVNREQAMKINCGATHEYHSITRKCFKFENFYL